MLLLVLLKRCFLFCTNKFKCIFHKKWKNQKYSEVETKEMFKLESDIVSLHSCRYAKMIVSMRTPSLIVILKESRAQSHTMFLLRNTERILNVCNIKSCNDPKTDISGLFCLDRLCSKIRIQDCSAPPV